MIDIPSEADIRCDADRIFGLIGHGQFRGESGRTLLALKTYAAGLA